MNAVRGEISLPTLRSTLATPDGKRRYVRRLFATIADRYDFITRFLSYGRDRRWKRRLIELAALGPSDRVLDLACGTGDLLLDAAPRVRHAVGLDVTLRMLQLAQRRAAAGARAPEFSRAHGGRSAGAGSGVVLVGGDMLALPFAAASFDVVTIGYGLRNAADLPQALREVHRVLAPGGRLLSLDFNRPANRLVRGAYLAYLSAVGSALGWVLHRDPDTYRYVPESIRTYPGAEGVSQLLAGTGFDGIRGLPLLGGLLTLHVACKSPGPTASPGTIGA